MAKASRPSPAKLIVGAIFASEGVLIQAKARLKKRFGPIDYESLIIPFDFTDYYTREIGENLSRQFFSFEKLISPAEFAAVKLYTNRLEKGFSRTKSRRSRTINLDPGYIAASKLVLASCKDFAHRIYLSKGVYAEITLQFRAGTFRSLPWTFPDYKSEAYQRNFLAIREIYQRQLSR